MRKEQKSNQTTNADSGICMTGDHLVRNMLLFAYPVAISALFQRLFQAADSVVVGRFAGANALAAVGGTSSFVEMFTWGLMGLSIGADVMVSQSLGKGDKESVQRAVHTAYAIAIISGFITMIFGIVCGRMILVKIGIPDEIIDWSVLYVRIYFVGLFFTVIYNFGAAVLRSSGDTKRPMLFLMVTGALNVILNLLLVCLFHLDVAGVAIATAISQITAAVMVTVTLIKNPGIVHLDLKKIRIDTAMAFKIITIGLPSMLQNMLFSISNILVQASINSFGSVTIAANSAANTLENFVYVSTTSFTQTNIAFTGQNAGAGNTKKIKQVMFTAMALTSVFGFTIGIVLNIFGKPMLGFFTTEPEVITNGIIRLRIVALWLFLNAVSDLLAGSMRAMGYSVVPTCAALLGICGFRLLYIFMWFPTHHTLDFLYRCYPYSWLITIAAEAVLWIIFYRTFCRKVCKD